MTVEYEHSGQELGQTIRDFPPELRDFYIRIFKGHYRELLPNELDRLADAFISRPSLINLTQERITILRESRRQRFNDMLSSENYRQLSDNLIYLPIFKYDLWKYIQTIVGYTRQPPLLVSGALADELKKYSPSLQYLSPTRKEELLTNPSLAREISIMKSTELGHIYLSSNRDLSSYGFPKGEDLEKWIQEVRLRKENITGIKSHEEENALDIGGGGGLAAFDFERVDSHVRATNLTISPELGMYQTKGGRVFRFAELMPQDFYEKFQYIISSNAFEHMKYPHLALVNALFALAVGGEMLLDFSFVGSHVRDEGQLPMLVKETPEVFDLIDNLAISGFIEFTSFHNINSDDFAGEGYTIPHGIVGIRKLKSFTPQYK